MPLSRTNSASSFDFDDGDESDGQAEIIAYGVASTVSLVPDQDIVIKTATTNKKFAKEPHDIRKECRILKQASHPNIVSLLAFHEDASSHTLQIHVPYVPLSLDNLLNQSTFTPSETPHFQAVARSIIFQVLRAVAYLHANPLCIAHRDLKPSNVLLTAAGCVKLIDFGVSYVPTSDPRDIWPEENGRMYFEVATGPYRAPELLFGTRSYDPYAADMWSLGCLFADFFTPLVPEEEDDEPPQYPPDIYPTLTRDTLFEGSRGEIGLIWSIFKIMGTASEENWPGFSQLPDAARVEFNQVPAVPLERSLPHLSEKVGLDLLYSLLQYPPSARIPAQEALKHAYLAGEILMPPDLVEIEGHSCISRTATGETLESLLQSIDPHSE